MALQDRLDQFCCCGMPVWKLLEDLLADRDGIVQFTRLFLHPSVFQRDFKILGLQLMGTTSRLTGGLEVLLALVRLTLPLPRQGFPLLIVAALCVICHPPMELGRSIFSMGELFQRLARFDIESAGFPFRTGQSLSAILLSRGRIVSFEGDFGQTEQQDRAAG